MKYFTSSPGDGTNVIAAAGAQIIYFIFGIIEMLLAFRFIFKILGANPNSPFVNFIYDYSWVFVQPFANIFPRATVRTDIVTSVFEPETVVALIIYALLAQLIMQVLSVLTRPVVTRVE